MENGFINSGQIAGLITSIPSVKELFESMIDEAETQINRSAQIIAAVTSK
jgi:enoyl-[acyl-carrier protein] reductase II